MIHAIVLSRILNRHHILHILHHTHRLFVTRVRETYWTDILIRDGVTDLAVLDFLFEFG